MEFVVKRSEWYRGEGPMWSRLLREKDGKKCCLGFLAQAYGYSEADIKNVHYFNGLADTGKIPACFFIDPSEGAPPGRVKNSDFAEKIASINDSKDIVTNAEREQKLTALFAEQGIQVRFED